MRGFVTIDFETANEQRRSACSVGLARFNQDGILVEEYTTLLHPHPECDYFLPMNTWVHGIDATQVVGAPTWDQVAGEVYSFIGEDTLVAHNMAFDGYVLADLADLYGLPMPTNRRMCTMRLARRILADELERKRLGDVYDYYFPGEGFDHHDAGADARACGRIFARMLDEYGWDRLEELCPVPGSRRRSAGLLADQLTTQALLDRYAVNPKALEGEHVCITGTLQHGKRAAVQELIEAVGGVADKSITKRTTLLVIGVPNPRSWAPERGASAKMTKATALRDAGSPIELLSEQEFFQRLEDASEE